MNNYTPTYWIMEEMGKFLETRNLPRVNHEVMENLNKPITSKEIESAIKNLPINKKVQNQMVSQVNFNKLLN